MPQDQGSENRVLAALGYPIWVVALVVLLGEMKYNRFMRLHAVQALGYTVAWVVIYIAFSIITAVPGLGLALALLWPVLYLVWLAGAIFFGYRAYQGQIFNIPVVSQVTARYAGTDR